MTIDELILIYRVQFPVLQEYERETFYDQRGKIVFTVNKGLSGVGVSRAEWEEIKSPARATSFRSGLKTGKGLSCRRLTAATRGRHARSLRVF